MVLHGTNTGVTSASVDTSYSWEKGELTVEAVRDRVESDKIALPPGRYFIGDPCYTAGYDDPAWQKWVNVTMSSARDELCVGTYNGYPVVGASTAYGDGVFYDQTGTEYPVDAGLVGVVSADLIERMGVPDSEYSNCGKFVTFDEETFLSRDSNGTITIGDTVIVTGDADEDNDESDWTESETD